MKITKIVTALSMLGIGLLSFSHSYAADAEQHLVRIPHIIVPNVSTLEPSGLSPKQVRVAYGIDQLFKAYPKLGRGYGQTIAIVNAYDHPNIEKDLEVFNTTFGITPCTTANGCFTKIYSTGQQPPANAVWAIETALDVEWAHAMAPKAKIMLVEVPTAGMNELMVGIQLAIQKGANVISMSWGTYEFNGEQNYDKYFNVSKVSFVAASGDWGTGGIYPAASPYVLSVGGTRLTLDSSGKVLSETAWAGSGGAISKFEKMPAYQTTYGLPNNPAGMRGFPDVSYNGDPVSGVPVYSTAPGQNNSGWLRVGGTSAGSPQWAGLVADANALGKMVMDGAQPALYAAAKSNYASYYRDITSGSNGSCGAICTASRGYDYVTGLGSPNAFNLIKAIAKK
jgi:subtilase family serine protease